MSDAMPIFRLMRLIRDARSTRNADRDLLYALALRCKPEKKFSCWPSYRQLSLDTMLDEITFRREAKRPEESGLIKHSIRPNRSNLFFINVPKLLDQVEEIEAKASLEVEEEQSPFGEVAFDDGDPDKTDSDTYYEDDANGFRGEDQ
jgi:hypothetical protein